MRNNFVCHFLHVALILLELGVVPEHHLRDQGRASDSSPILGEHAEHRVHERVHCILIEGIESIVHRTQGNSVKSQSCEVFGRKYS